MHYFKRNIGDYHKKAGRLTMVEHGAYTLLLDACYDRERFPTEAEAIDWCWARTEEEISAVKFVLGKFFTLEDGFYVQHRVKEEIEAYQAKAENNARIAKEREEKRKKAKQGVNDSPPNVHGSCNSGDEAPPNHKPLTKNQEPRTIKEEETTSTPPPVPREEDPPSSSPDPGKIPDEAQNRATQLAVLLRRGGASPSTHTGSKGMAELVQTEATDAEVLTALETAKRQREESGSSQAIPVAYLVPIVREMRNKPADPAEREPPDKWWASNAGIDRKARELGMFARGNEDYPSFKDRIFDEIRRRKSVDEEAAA